MSAARIQPVQIRAIHAIKTKVRLDEASYRALLQGFGAGSSKDLSEDEADRLLARMRDIPGASSPVQRVATSKQAAGRYAPKLQAMWLALHDLGAIDDRRDAAMHAFVKRQTGLDHTRFLKDAASAAAAIEALKAMLVRSGVAWPAVTGDRLVDITAMKRAILRAQWRRLIALGAAQASGPPDEWDDPSLAPADLDRVSAALGAKIRKAQAAAREARDAG